MEEQNRADLAAVMRAIVFVANTRIQGEDAEKISKPVGLGKCSRHSTFDDRKSVAIRAPSPVVLALMYRPSSQFAKRTFSPC